MPTSLTPKYTNLVPPGQAKFVPVGGVVLDEEEKVVVEVSSVTGGSLVVGVILVVAGVAEMICDPEPLGRH